MTTDRDKRARIRSCDAIVKRTSRAQACVVNAMVSEALEDDRMGEGVATGQYISAERDLEQALALVRDCRRSIEGRSE